MTLERAYIAFHTGEPIIYKPLGKEYTKITEIIITHKNNRSLVDRINHHGEQACYFLILDKNQNSVIRTSAEDLQAIDPEPPEEVKQYLLKGFLRI